MRGSAFASALGEWVAGSGTLSATMAERVAVDAERLLRSADRGAWGRPGFRSRAALYVLLAGSRRGAEILLRVCFSEAGIGACLRGCHPPVNALIGAEGQDRAGDHANIGEPNPLAMSGLRQEMAHNRMVLDIGRALAGLWIEYMPASQQDAGMHLEVFTRKVSCLGGRACAHYTPS